MWLLKEKTFLHCQDTELDAIRHELDTARKSGRLTIVVGNSPSRSAAYLHNWMNPGAAEAGVSWEDAVRSAAIKVGLPEHLYEAADTNYLALAQAIITSSDVGRSQLIQQFSDALTVRLADTLIHKILVEINPDAIITTNYDFQLEYTFERAGKDWTAYVRNIEQIHHRDHVKIFKMHGTLQPPDGLSDKYVYARGGWDASPNDSIVISENDYDQCLEELRNSPNAPLLNALRRPCLIIGKGFYWQDLSFQYALRETRSTDSSAVTLVPSISAEERLNLYNLNIQLLMINMPAARHDEHYYVSLVYALLHLFPDLRGNFEAQIEAFSDSQNLFREPEFVAVGLAAHNTSGQLIHRKGDSLTQEIERVLPPSGRHSMALTNTEEYAGGAALTAAAALAALDAEDEFDCAIISAVGKNDIYRDAIFQFCDEMNIDYDGVSPTADVTWRSTILIHDDHLESITYSGQRVFLDRSFERDLEFSEEAREQLRTQIGVDQDNLRIFYFDKFMALPYPPHSSTNKGLLEQHKADVETLSANRPDVDIVYETGSSGSEGFVVENSFAPLINIVTASFRFLARNVLDDQERDQIGGNIKLFSSTDWYKTTFTDEIPAIEIFLNAIGADQLSDHVTKVSVKDRWVKHAGKWAGRQHNRRWFVTTLHHLGAYAIDVNSAQAYYIAPHNFDPDEIENTAGAGDVFRGAFCYALLKLPGKVTEEALLPKCLEFAVQVSAEKCKYLKMTDAYRTLPDFGQQVLETLL